MARAIVVFLAGLLMLAPVGRAEPIAAFLYVEANEGDSSGGHAALRLGDEVFHFQYEPGRLLRLVREDWPHFREAYGRLGNRRIHERRLAASEDTVALLRDSFARRLLEEGAERRLLAALVQDRALLDAIDEAPHGFEHALPGVEGAGLFASASADEEPRLAALRSRLFASEGAGFLAARRTEAIATVRSLRPPARHSDWILAASERPLALPRAFSEVVYDALARLQAIEVVQAAPRLADATLRAPQDDVFRLDDAELRALLSVADRLEGRVRELLSSASSDAGRTLLVLLARLAAADRSLETGRLVFLEAFPASSRTLAAPLQEEIVAGVRAEAQAALEEARRALVASAAPGEMELAEIEAAANRRLEIDAAVREGRALRVANAGFLPSARRLPAAPPLPALTPSELAEAKDRSRQDLAAFEADFQARHGYDLLTRNCVTELFRGIDRAFADAGEEPIAASESRLGGHVDAGAFARFIPFVADAEVGRSWRLLGTRVLPSERELQISAMRKDESALLVAVRESNTLTARSYALRARGSFFLFFTDDAVWLRPLLGAVNLAASLGQAGAGIALLPFDRGESFASGLEGALFSVPELLFVSLRKGTLAWAPPRALEDDTPSGAIAAQ